MDYDKNQNGDGVFPPFYPIHETGGSNHATGIQRKNFAGQLTFPGRQRSTLGRDRLPHVQWVRVGSASLLFIGKSKNRGGGAPGAENKLNLPVQRDFRERPCRA